MSLPDFQSILLPLLKLTAMAKASAI